jgi:uncharacterized protein YfaS (alpha-2-macroglobulin family)
MPGGTVGKAVGFHIDYVAIERNSIGDFTILELNRPAFDLSDRGVTGRPSPGPVEAFLYTERGIYRPGETESATASTTCP